jgi:hypothetical protein
MATSFANGARLIALALKGATTFGRNARAVLLFGCLENLRFGMQ